MKEEYFNKGDVIVYNDSLYLINEINKIDVIPMYEVRFIAGRPYDRNVCRIPVHSQDMFEKYSGQRYHKDNFKPYDKVLVRDSDNDEWRCSLFSHINIQYMFITVSGSYLQCIPYEPNKELVGTTDAAHEFYITWK